MPTIRRIGVLTGGGDAPGLNAVIRAVVKSACNSGIEVSGLEDSFDGLIYPDKSRVLTPQDVTGILRLGGTVLGTVNRGDPFAELFITSGRAGICERWGASWKGVPCWVLRLRVDSGTFRVDLGC